MKAKLITNETPNGSRSTLGQILPLATPKAIQFFPVYACNFKCEYCFYALSKKKKTYDCDTEFMDFTLFKKGIDDVKSFPEKVKMLRITGLGETLMHKNIAEMISYAKKSEMFENINILTNAVLLTNELSLKLVAAGLDMLRISIQGISSQQYKEISGKEVDFEKMVNDIRFFYKHRGETKVYIKIIDYALKSEDDKNKFFEIFGDICDIIAIENLTPTVGGVDYEKISGGKDLDKTQNGNVLADSKICPMPFYMMQINPDGYVIPCCSWQIPIKIGNIKEKSVVEIWNSKTFNEFRACMLTGVENCGEVCTSCNHYRYAMFPEDRLDSYVDKLLPVYKS